MTEAQTTPELVERPFVREERYIVFKLSDLTEEQERQLRFMICPPRGDRQIRTRECVVVEHDWPEYEVVWRMIEERMSRG